MSSTCVQRQEELEYVPQQFYKSLLSYMGEECGEIQQPSQTRTEKLFI